MKKFLSVFLALTVTVLTAFPACAKWKVDSYGNIKDGRSSVIISYEDTYNCRLSISGSTLSVVGDDGNALSADNPCIVGIKSNTTGKTEAAAFTSPVSVTFGASSDTDGNLFGITDVNWGNQMPWFVGVVTDGSSNYFGLSRVPLKQTGTTAATVCQKNDTDCDGDSDFMILATGLTLANWTGKNITQVGWFYATYATTGSAWTFSLTDGVTTGRAGFAKNYENLFFTFPTGQMGAASGSYFYQSGGTPPVWSSSYYVYSIDRNGRVLLKINLTGDGGTDGAGAVPATLLAPFLSLQSNSDSYYSAMTYLDPTTLNEGFFNITGSSAGIFIYRNSSATARTQVQFSAWTNGNREISGSITYQTVTN